MHTWYRTVCDSCKEHVHLCVTSTFWVFDTSKNLLGDEEKKIVGFLSKHYGCELRLVWRDDQYEEGMKTGSAHLLNEYKEFKLDDNA